MPSRRQSWVPAAVIAVTAFLGILGYETGRAVAGHDPAIPAATPTGALAATPAPRPSDDELVPPADPQGPVTRAS